MPSRYPEEIRRQVLELAQAGTRVAQLSQTFGMTEGAISVLPIANADDQSNPDVAAYTQAVKALGAEPLDPNVITGYIYMEAIYTAAKKIGLDKVDSASLANFLNTATDVHLPMSRTLLNPGPGGWPQVKQPYRQLVQWKGGKIVTVQENSQDGWLKGW